MTKMLHSPDRRPNRNWAAASYSTMPNPIAPPPLECGCSNCSHLVVVLLMTVIIPRHIHRPPLSLHQSIQQEKKATTLSNSLTHSLTPPPSVDDANLLGSNCRVPNLWISCEGESDELQCLQADSPPSVKVAVRLPHSKAFLHGLWAVQTGIQRPFSEEELHCCSLWGSLKAATLTLENDSLQQFDTASAC